MAKPTSDRDSALCRWRHWAGAMLALALLALPAAASGSFPGQNGRIFYQRSGDIFSVNPDGSGTLDLTPGGIYGEERPMGSADGHHVAFQSFRDEGWNIFSINDDSTGLADLTNTKSPVINFEPAWSPDGSKVVFMRQNLTPGEQDLWTVNANGTGQVNLTNSPGVEETGPEFSPDGSKILFLSSGPDPCCSPGYNNDVWVMNANGTSPTQLTETDGPAQNIGATWSPDGTKIAFSRVSAPVPADNGIYVMNANGTNQVQLLNGGSPILAGNLSWSPDGTRIAYEGSGGGFLLTVAASGGPSSPLVSSSAASYPSWVPVATAIAGSLPGSGGTPGGGAPAPVSNPAPKHRLKCPKGKKKKVVHGKAKCVKKHRSHKAKHKH